MLKRFFSSNKIVSGITGGLQKKKQRCTEHVCIITLFNKCVSTVVMMVTRVPLKKTIVCFVFMLLQSQKLFMVSRVASQTYLLYVHKNSLLTQKHTIRFQI